MRKQRFPFLIAPRRNEPSLGASPAGAILNALSKLAEADGELKEKTSRVLAALSLVESSLDALAEKTDGDERWREFYQKLIPILDGIDAVRRAIEREGDPSWNRGMEISSDKLTALLEAHGLHQTARVGMTFDPTRHEAVGVSDASAATTGSVAEVVENGWLYQGRVLRFAKVLVARGGS